jgi:hypothetical protein
MNGSCQGTPKDCGVLGAICEPTTGICI